jgi:hypothetical protein
MQREKHYADVVDNGGIGWIDNGGVREKGYAYDGFAGYG